MGATGRGLGEFGRLVLQSYARKLRFFKLACAPTPRSSPEGRACGVSAAIRAAGQLRDQSIPAGIQHPSLRFIPHPNPVFLKDIRPGHLGGPSTREHRLRDRTGKPGVRKERSARGLERKSPARGTRESPHKSWIKKRPCIQQSLSVKGDSCRSPFSNLFPDHQPETL